jgi:hypothetical protein
VAAQQIFDNKIGLLPSGSTNADSSCRSRTAWPRRLRAAL